MRPLLFFCAHLILPTGLSEEARTQPSGQRRASPVSAAWKAELDGRPPAEQVLEVLKYQSLSSQEVQYQAFQQRKPLGPLIGASFYDDYQDVHVKDMDRDGKDELLFVGYDSRWQRSPASVWSWEGEAWRDRIWGLSPGYAMELVDVNQDKVQELVGFSRSDAGVQIQVLCFAEDGLLRPCPTPASKDWLLPLLEQLAASPKAVGLEYRVPLLVDAADLYALRPHNPDALQRKLEERIAETTEKGELSAWLDMMVWAGSPKALPFLTELSRSPDKPDPLLATAMCRLGGRDEAVDLLRRNMESGRREPWQQRHLSTNIVEECPGDSAWLAALIQDKTLPFPARADLVTWTLPEDPAGLELAFSLVSDPALRGNALYALAMATREGAHPRWTVSADRIGPLLTTLPPDFLDILFEILRNLSDGLPYLEASLKLPLSADAQTVLLQALADLGSDKIDAVQFLHHAEDERLRWSLHKNLIRSGDGQRIAQGLALAQGESELAIYAQDLKDVPRPWQGPGWQAVEARALSLLGSEDEGARQHAIGLLAWFSTPTARAALEQQLHHNPEMLERIDAANALAQQTGTEPLIIARLQEIAAQPLAQYEREQLWVALGSMQSPEALNYLAAELIHTPLAWDPAEQLATPQGDALHRAYLLSMPTDTPEQCEEAILRLIPPLRAGIPSAPEELRHLLARCGAEDPTPIVTLLPNARVETLRALQPELRAWTEHPERTVRVPALEALLKLEEAETSGLGMTP